MYFFVPDDKRKQVILQGKIIDRKTRKGNIFAQNIFIQLRN